MDNILFVPAIRELEWVQDILPGTSPAELSVGGRRVIEYALESAHKFEVMFTEVLDWRFSERLADYFADPTRTGYPVFYVRGEGPMPTGLKGIEGYSSPLTSHIDDGLVVVWGVALPMNGTKDVSLEPVSDVDLADTPAGVYRREGGRWMRILPRGFVVDSIKAWHSLNFQVLRQPENFTLPGYSTEPNVHLGRNVVLEHGTEVKPPVLLQDNTWFARNVRLDGDVIVNSYRTIVGRDTFIGAGLDLDGKIVAGRRVIDPETGTWVDLEEPGIARHIPTGLGWMRKLWRFMRGRSFGRRG